jgi:hypothetical protein
MEVHLVVGYEAAESRSMTCYSACTFASSLLYPRRWATGRKRGLRALSTSVWLLISAGPPGLNCWLDVGNAISKFL